MKEKLLAPNAPPFPFIAGTDSPETSFAPPTVLHRWPVIITDAINCVLKADARERDPRQGSKVIALLSALKYEIQRTKPFGRLQPSEIDEEKDDILLWNDAIEKFFPTASFFSASWLFAECYLYRRIHEAINSQPSWKGFDVFLPSKISGFRELHEKVAAIAEAQQLLSLDPSKFKAQLRELLLLSLWGNATDLSMFAGLSQEQVHDMRSGASGEKNILSNHLDQIISYVDERFATGDSKTRLDFILDNSGFELFSDLILSDYLHQTCRVSKTVFHCKTIPWFVSDTLPADFEWLLESLEAPVPFFFPNTASGAPRAFPVSACNSLATRWRGYITSGKWIITCDPIWCSFWAHHHLPREAPVLFKELEMESDLVIFKGDLNYRKLVYDCKFPATFPFKNAIGDISRLKAVASLRTLKSDPIVGLEDGVEEKLLKEGKADWRWNGKLAVVEFYYH